LRLLDSGSFGNGVTIGKSITITGNDNTLILTGPIAISASGAKVAFRNLLLTGLGTVSTGIVVTAAASVHLVDCQVERFESDGIAAGSGTTELFVSDTISRNNGSNGLRVNGNGATRVSVDNSQFENNALSGAAISDAQTIVTRSTFSGNGDAGLAVTRGSGNIAWSTVASNGGIGFVVDDAAVQLLSSVTRANATAGLSVGEGGTASISKVTVTQNAIGLFNLGALRTRQNNRVFGNGDDFDGIAPIALGGT
jgi:hypothetical protein